MAPYQANKPMAADQMSISQGDLQNNFLALKALVDVNHETFGSAYEGKHSIVSFPQQAPSVVPPIFPPATAATELAMYAKADGGATHLFLRPTNQLPGIDTNDINITKSGKANNGWCILPSGIKIAWGIISVPGGSTGTPGTNTLTLTNPTIAGFPGFSFVYNAQVTAIHSAGMDKYVWAYDLQFDSVGVKNPNSHAVDTYIFVIGS